MPPQDPPPATAIPPGRRKPRRRQQGLITLALSMDNTVERAEQIQLLREEQQALAAFKA